MALQSLDEHSITNVDSSVAVDQFDHQDDIVFVDPSEWQSANQRKRQREIVEIEDESGEETDRAYMTVPPQLKNRKLVPRTQCKSCFEEISLRKIVKLVCCDEAYCRSCFNSWLQVKLRNGLPHCCDKPMRYNVYEPFLTPATRKMYQKTMEESNTRDPLHCGKRDCGRFLGATKTAKGEFVTCPNCKSRTCVQCKGLSVDHRGIHKLCPPDINNPMLEDLAVKFGWRKCPKCFARIEKISGCDHFRCRCGCEFRYCCGKRTRECKCEHEV